jgi:hypothetical protein
VEFLNVPGVHWDFREGLSHNRDGRKWNIRGFRGLSGRLCLRIERGGGARGHQSRGGEDDREEKDVGKKGFQARNSELSGT